MATKTKPILVPVDFSSFSKAALMFAAELSERMSAPLVILHVVHDPGEAPGFYAGRQPKDQMLRQEDVAKQMMDEFTAHVISENPQSSALKKAETSLSVGLPVKRILETAERRGAYLIVMGSRGRTGLSHLLLGSKAEQVLRQSSIPVTIVKSEPEVQSQ